MRTSILALLIAASAQAATQSYNGTATADGTGDAANIYLTKFDASLGTLTAVNLVLNTLSIGGSFDAKANGTGRKISVVSNQVYLYEANGESYFTNYFATTDTANANKLTVSPSLSGTVLNNTAYQTFTVDTLTAVTDQLSNIDSALWGFYTGTGDVTFALTSNPNVTTTASVYQIDATGITAFADLSIYYTYTPNAIPEPSTYGMMLGGLALAAVAIRRRRKASKA